MIRIAFWEAASGKMCQVSEREQAWLQRDSCNNTGEAEWWLTYSWELWDGLTALHALQSYKADTLLWSLDVLLDIPFLYLA